MFKYITVDNGAFVQALIAFIVTFSVFALVMFRAWRMRSDESDHVANLPLNHDSETEHTHTTKP